MRYYGATDVPLSTLGREQAHATRRAIPGTTFESVWSSTLSRAWEFAEIIAPEHPVRIDASFCEIDFGRWEGLTREEIQAIDPELSALWQTGGSDFGFPEGESRARFRARIEAGLARIQASGVRSALVVAHKGVVRTLLELVTGQTLPPDLPELGGVVQAYRDLGGSWRTGRQGSDASCSAPAVGIPLQGTPL